MKKRVLIAIAVAMLPAVGKSQQDDTSLERQIEVTRQYVPEVEGARKIDFAPRMQDTVTLRPEIKYSITPTPWKSVFGTTPIAPVAISDAEYKPVKPAYLMLGGGYPAQSAADLYVAFPTRRDVRSGLYLNHYGQWSMMKSESHGWQDAAWTENRLGVYAGRDFARRSLDFDFKGKFNYYQPFEKVWSGCIEPPNIYCVVLDASLRFGDSFTDFSRFNYRFGIDGGTWFNGRADGEAFMGTAFADFGWKAGKGAVLTGVSARGWKSQRDYDWYAAIVPQYSLLIGKFSMAAGVKVYYNESRLGNYSDSFATSDRYHIGKQVYVLPKVGLSYSVAAAFIPYLDLDGEIGDGSYPALSVLNPYIQDCNVARPKSTQLRGGFRGSAAELITYDLYAGYMIAELPCFVKIAHEFIPELTPVNWFYAGVGAALELPAGFGLKAGFRYNSYDTSGNLWSNAGGRRGMGIPEFTISGEVNYRYRDKLFVNAGVEVMGERRFASENDLWTEVPASVNLRVAAEYKTGPRFSVFAKGDNLLGQRIYRYLGYPALGANVVAGVKMIF